MRNILSADLSFGLFGLPIKVYSLIQKNEISLHQFSPKGNRIRLKRVDEKTGEEVAYEDIKNGYQATKNSEVTIIDKTLLKEEGTHDLRILGFASKPIDLIGIDVDKYALLPSKKEREYCMLRDALREARKPLICLMTARTKEKIVLVVPYGKILLAIVLIYKEQIRELKDYEALLDEKQYSANEKDLVTQFLGTLPLINLDEIKDKSKEKLLELLKGKVPLKAEVKEFNDTAEAMKKMIEEFKKKKAMKVEAV